MSILLTSFGNIFFFFIFECLWLPLWPALMPCLAHTRLLSTWNPSIPCFPSYSFPPSAARTPSVPDRWVRFNALTRSPRKATPPTAHVQQQIWDQFLHPSTGPVSAVFLHRWDKLRWSTLRNPTSELWQYSPSYDIMQRSFWQISQTDFWWDVHTLSNPLYRVCEPELPCKPTKKSHLRDSHVHQCPTCDSSVTDTSILTHTHACTYTHKCTCSCMTSREASAQTKVMLNINGILRIPSIHLIITH